MLLLVDVTVPVVFIVCRTLCILVEISLDASSSLPVLEFRTFLVQICDTLRVEASETVLVLVVILFLVLVAGTVFAFEEETVFLLESGFMPILVILVLVCRTLTVKAGKIMLVLVCGSFLVHVLFGIIFPVRIARTVFVPLGETFVSLVIVTFPVLVSRTILVPVVVLFLVFWTRVVFVLVSEIVFDVVGRTLLILMCGVIFALPSLDRLLVVLLGESVFELADGVVLDSLEAMLTFPVLVMRYIVLLADRTFSVLERGTVFILVSGTFLVLEVEAVLVLKGETFLTLMDGTFLVLVGGRLIVLISVSIIVLVWGRKSGTIKVKFSKSVLPEDVCLKIFGFELAYIANVPVMFDISSSAE